MKSTSPKFLLAAIALILAIVLSAGIFIFCDVQNISSWKLAGITFAISLITSIFLFFFIDTRILKKINQLSLTVKNFRTQGESTLIVDEHNGGYEIENLRKEILAWADDRKDEIERLKKLEVYRKEFLGNVSHELKTPIFNIQGYVLTLLEGGLEDETINRDYLARAERSIDRMITIVDDLEAISQLETGELQLEPERFDIVALSKDILEAQEMKATGKGIMLSIDSDVKSLFVYADRFRIRQVLTNLVVNSIKYGKEYGETKIHFYDNNDVVQIEVNDNGIGVAPQHIPRLFERFYRVDKSRSREQGGTGLGLAIVKHIIEAHDQTITASSTEGVGTTFTFTLAKG
ncbi:MAG TPA: ATP-binding protein [Bacteroidia bacterium]|jgi:two-component system phosphate regulon sensor histidine kinase PhoR|nr:ATP-binding protein [Bacteroidia bacterium]